MKRRKEDEDKGRIKNKRNRADGDEGEDCKTRGVGMPSDPSFFPRLKEDFLFFSFLPKGRKVRNPSRFEFGLDFLPSVYLSLSVHPLSSSSSSRGGQKELESSIDFGRMKVHIPFH